MRYRLSLTCFYYPQWLPSVHILDCIYTDSLLAIQVIVCKRVYVLAIIKAGG